MTKGDRERLRAELAGKAMASMLGERQRIGREFGFEPLSEIALGAVMAADALLAELERTAEDPIKAGGTE